MDVFTGFSILVTTSRVFMPGFPTDISPAAVKYFAPTTSAAMSLTHRGGQVLGPSASCTLPRGLQAGSKADLDFPTSQPPPNFAGGLRELPKTTVYTTKIYWGDHESVPDGQPKVNTEVVTCYESPTNADTAAAYPRWANGRWSKYGLAARASSVGTYNLRTSFCGSTSVTLNEGQNFLPAIELTSPDHEVDLKDSVTVTWNPVENAEGYALTVQVNKDYTNTVWTSASKPIDYPSCVDQVTTRKDLDRYIEDGIILPPSTTTCHIPAGIFKGCGNVDLYIYAFGTDLKQKNNGIESSVIVRSRATVTLGPIPEWLVRSLTPTPAETSGVATTASGTPTPIAAHETNSRAHWIFEVDTTTNNSIEDDAASNPPMATNSLNMRLASEASSIQDPEASVTIPESLGLGAKAVFSVRAKEDTVTPPMVDYVTLKTYHGSASEVPAGQPVVSKITRPDDEAVAKSKPVPDSLSGLQVGVGGIYADWLSAGAGKLGPDASCCGVYGLTTNYCGSASAIIGPEQNFMPAVEILSPTTSVDLTTPVDIAWKQIPGAAGYFVRATGGSSNESVEWTSNTTACAAEQFPSAAIRRSDVSGLIARGVLLSPETTTCRIPARIFAGCNKATVTVTAVGTDKAVVVNGIDTALVVRSRAFIDMQSAQSVGQD